MNFILENWEQIIWTPLVGIGVWFFTKRNLQKANESKARAEATSADITNITSNFKVYQDLINDLEGRFKNRITDLEEDLNKMKVLNEELRKAIGNQERYIKKLQTKLQEYEKLEG